MPRLTEASRQARRDAIATAALQVFDRRGVAHASTADIIETLGGSTGGMYSHFASKAELVRFIAERVLIQALATVVPAEPAMISPQVILRAALVKIEDAAPTAIIVQLWGEATIDEEMREVVLETLGRVEASLREAVLPWARTGGGDPVARAARLARAMRAIIQGYIAQLALFDHPSAADYFDDLAMVLAGTT